MPHIYSAVTFFPLLPIKPSDHFCFYSLSVSRFHLHCPVTLGFAPAFSLTPTCQDSEKNTYQPVLGTNLNQHGLCLFYFCFSQIYFSCFVLFSHIKWKKRLLKSLKILTKAECFCFSLSSVLSPCRLLQQSTTKGMAGAGREGTSDCIPDLPTGHQQSLLVPPQPHLQWGSPVLLFFWILPL